MDKRRKPTSRNPHPLLQRCAPFLCALVFATSFSSGEALPEEASDKNAGELKGDTREVELAGDHDEEGLHLVGGVASRSQALAKISKRSIYDSRIPSPHRRYLGTWGSAPFGTTGNDWDTFHDPTLPWGGAMKRGENGYSYDYGDSWWGRPAPHEDSPNSNTYMESTYIPHRFFGAFKRVPPYARAGAYLHRPTKGNGVRGAARIMPPTGRPITRRRRSASLGKEQSKTIRENPIYMRKRHPSHYGNRDGNSSFHGSRSRRQSQPGMSSNSYDKNAKTTTGPVQGGGIGHRREIMKRRAEIIYRRFLGDQR